MSTEIERKFLIADTVPAYGGMHIKQGMLKDRDPMVRVRVYGSKAFLTVKGPQVGITRPEFEYEIPVEDAEAMFAYCTDFVEKTRWLARTSTHVWEIDVFEGDNDGLVVAEVELQSEDEEFEKPRWAGEEVTHDPRYLNSNLAKNPYKNWAAAR
jgi:adenylate cyclase